MGQEKIILDFIKCCFFKDAMASVKMDNKSRFNKKKISLWMCEIMNGFQKN